MVAAAHNVDREHAVVCRGVTKEFGSGDTRTVALGGDRLTTSLSESMNISYAEAEGIKPTFEA